MQPCALRSPSGSRERKKETKDALSYGYVQLELEAVAENEHALALYRSVGFVEYGRNPKGFRSRKTGWQKLVLMQLELNKQAAEQDLAGSEMVGLSPIAENIKG